MEYTVELTLITEKTLTEDVLLDAAELGGAAGGNVGERRLSLTLTEPADSVATAMLAATRRLTKVIPGQVIQASAARTEEWDRLADEVRARSELVGVAEVAELLGLSRPRVTEMVRDRRDVPMPIALLKSGPVWRKTEWSTFASGWKRKPGRPRKAPVVDDTNAGEIDAPDRPERGHARRRVA